jgi:hypothetical protein
MPDLTFAWEELLGALKRYPKALPSLNPPCPDETIRDVERDLGFTLPAPLVALLKLNNGQILEAAGIFKSVSGWDAYFRHVFLDAESVAIAYRALIRDENLVEEFGLHEIPFAVEGRPDHYKEMYSIHSKTQKVSLLWTFYDPTLPASWGTQKLPRGEDLAEFLGRQVALYL